jgi:hypothetical protein
MDFINMVKGWIGALTELGLMLIALGVVAGLLVGANVPFIPAVTTNIISFVDSLGKAGLVGLLALGFILWLLARLPDHGAPDSPG